MFEELKEIICEYVDVAPETIKENSRFIEDLGFNSYDFMSKMCIRDRRASTARLTAMESRFTSLYDLSMISFFTLYRNAVCSP